MLCRGESRCFTLVEIEEFLGFAGKLNFFGLDCLPVAAFRASQIQQSTGNLRIAEVPSTKINQVVPKLLYRSPTSISSGTYLKLSDAAQSIQPYRRTGYFSGILVDDATDLIHYVLDWYRSKQSRNSFSSIGSETLTAATSADRSVLIAESLQALHGAGSSLSLGLNVDSLDLRATITTVYEGKDYILRPIVARPRDFVESGEIYIIHWTLGQKNIADALIERSPLMYRALNSIFLTGAIDGEIVV